MSENVSSGRVWARDRAASAARLAAAGAWVVALTILALHAIKPDLEPSWRFVSEYATGPHAWIMKLAFLAWAAGLGALAVAARREVADLRGRIGVVVLWIVAVALVFAGLFAQDPVTSKPEQATTSGMIHALASMVGIPGTPLAALLISSSLWRRGPTWGRHRPALMGAAHATWLSLALMAAYLMWAVPRAGGFNDQVYAGWMNRLVVAAYLFWQWVVASRLGASRAEVR